MLVAHVFGASIVEGLIGALGVAFLQKRYPEYLVSLRSVFATDAAVEGQASQPPLWQLVAAIMTVSLPAIAAFGLVLGGGDPARSFGSDWSSVDWAAVATMLLIVGIVLIVVVPLVYLVLPRSVKRIGTAFVALAVIAPLGLIAPGFAYGEGTTRDVEAAFGYVPQGLRDLSTIFSAPLGGYNLPLPFFSDANAELWHAAIGYEIAGVVGMLLVGAVTYGLVRLIRPRAPEPLASGPVS
jgi:hypothetical protein